MLKVGLTGGIGAGKTTIARIFRQLGYPVYIADIEASRLMNTDFQIRRELSELVGMDIYTQETQVDKKKLADIIFKHPEILKQVNRIVHPRVVADFNNWCVSRNAKIVFFETAILFEAGLEKNVDYTICIYASPEARIKRVMVRDQTTAEKVMARMENQMDDQEKCRRSDFTIYTDGEIMVMEQINLIIEKLENTKK